MKRLILLLLGSIVLWSAFCHSAFAQTKPVTASPKDSTSEILFKTFPPPQEVVIWGIGPYGSIKGSLNTSFKPFASAASLPELNEGNSFPVLGVSSDFGVTFYTPTLFGVFGLNLDAGLSSYKYGTQYIFKNILPADTSEYRPTFTTQLNYLTFSPMLNLSGLLFGVKIGIPLSGTITYPTATTNPKYIQIQDWKGQQQDIDKSLLNTLIEARVGGMVKLLSSRLGVLHLTINGSLAINSALKSDSLTNTIVKNSLMAQNLKTEKKFEPVDAIPFSVSVGLNYLFSITNGSIVDDHIRQQEIVDSIRTTERKIFNQAAALQAQSLAQADTVTNTVLATMEINDKIKALEKARQDRLDKLAALEKARQDSIRRSLAKELTETKKKVFVASVTAITGAQEDGKDLGAVKELRVEQFSMTSSKPLLPIIFFNDNSSVLPDRYKRIRSSDRENFALPSNPNASTLEVYATVLNIIGKRLIQNPTAKLVLTGCNADAGDEKGNTKLSAARAEAVSGYLQDVWKIQGKRIDVRQRNLPERSSAAVTPNGMAENRRVEIASETPEILAPMTYEYTGKIAAPSALNFALEITTGVGLKQWEFEIQQLSGAAGTTLKDTSGGAIYPQRLTWRLNDEPATIPTSNDPIAARLSAYDVNNAQSPDAPVISLPVKQYTLEQKRREGRPDIIIRNIELLAGTSSSDAQTMSTSAKDVAAKFASTLPAQAKLSAAFSHTKNESGTPSWASAMGEAIKLPANALRSGKTVTFDTTFPEARFYARSLNVRVETPAK